MAGCRGDYSLEKKDMGLGLVDFVVLPAETLLRVRR